MSTRFVSNDELWRELQSHVASGKRIRACHRLLWWTRGKAFATQEGRQYRRGYDDWRSLTGRYESEGNSQADATWSAGV